MTIEFVVPFSAAEWYVCAIVLRLEIPTLLVLTALFVYCTDGSRTHFLYYGLYQRCEN